MKYWQKPSIYRFWSIRVIRTIINFAQRNFFSFFRSCKLFFIKNQQFCTNRIYFHGVAKRAKWRIFNVVLKKLFRPQINKKISFEAGKLLFGSISKDPTDRFVKKSFLSNFMKINFPSILVYFFLYQQIPCKMTNIWNFCNCEFFLFLVPPPIF